jgi:hypothetical protein
MSASKQDEQSVETEATNMGTAQSPKKDIKDETENLAPLHRYDGVPLKSNHYNVTLFEGHTRKKH